MVNTLTPQQRKVVYDCNGLFAVRACPGSGKTFSVAARLATKLQSWTEAHCGIATISFTNVAWQEIQTQILGNPDCPGIEVPHFLGTIDSFINRYLVFPFGHLIMGCSSTPKLVGEPYGTWHASPGKGPDAYYGYFDKTTYDIFGNVIPTVPVFPNPFHFPPSSFKKNPPDGHIRNIRTIKETGWRRGFFTQADASYIALQLLKRFPYIADLLITRFPVFIVDEAQDTCDIHMAIIDLLIEHGLAELMLVGDPDQAIFEWNNANPELFNEKFKLWKDSSVELNESRRSTQELCNFTYKLSSLQQPPSSIAKDIAHIHIQPIVCSYEATDVPETIRQFKSICLEHSIQVSPSTTAVLYRGSSFAATLMQEKPPASFPWISSYPTTKEIISAKYIFDGGNIKLGIERIIKTYIKLLYGENSCNHQLMLRAFDELGYSTVIEKAYSLIISMPNTRDNSLPEWIRLYNDNAVLKAWSKVGIDSSKLEQGLDSISCFFSRDRLCDAYPDFTLGTIHSVKGQTFEAVLLFLKQRTGNSQYYKTLLSKPNKFESEEMRVVYVGMTRPRKLLMLAVPPADLELWKSLL